MKKKNSWATRILFIFLVLLAVAARLYRIDNSLTEWFSWRQTDTAAVARFLLKDNFNLLKPRYYDLSNIQSGLDNPKGLRMVELPLYNALFAYLYKIWPVLSLEIWGRLVTAAFSIIALAVIFYLLEQEFGLLEAFFAGLFFAIAPFVVFYSRVILPDMPAISTALLSIFFMYKFRQKGWFNFILGTIFSAAALLIKPTVIFYLLVGLYFLYKRKYAVRAKMIILMFVYILLSLLPLFLWRSYISAFPEGIPANDWLLTSVNTPNGLEKIFFKPAFFRWVFFERINNLILGGYLVFFVILSLFVFKTKSLNVHYPFLLASALYLFVFQGGNVQHDYYQTIITPTLAILVGVGMGWFLRQRTLSVLVWRYLAALLIFASSLFFSFYQVKGYYNEREDLLLIANIIGSFTEKNDIIITDAQGDTTLLYLADRKGYPSPYRDFSILKEQGAKYFVTSDISYKERFEGVYKLLFENDKVLLFEL